MKDISAKTKLAGILGNPVAHSRSPELHSFLAEQTGVDLVYLAFLAEKDRLRTILDGAMAMNFVGFNITSPFKTDVFSLVDALDADAEKMGNVNTIINREGKWIGYNTDGDGFIRSLMRSGFDPQGKEILILGTGGAARTLSYKLAQRGAKSISVSSRQPHALEKMAPALFGYSETALYEGVCKDKLYDLVVNCTPLGMAPYADKNPMPAGVQYHPALFCYDLIYHPEKTLFLQEAERQGAKILNGLSMFLYQGFLAYEHFTGISPDDTLCDSVFKKWGIELAGTKEN